MDRTLIIILILAVLYHAGIPVAKLRDIEAMLIGQCSAEDIINYLAT